MDFKTVKVLYGLNDIHIILGITFIFGMATGVAFYVTFEKIMSFLFKLVN